MHRSNRAAQPLFLLTKQLDPVVQPLSFCGNRRTLCLQCIEILNPLGAVAREDDPIRIGKRCTRRIRGTQLARVIPRAVIAEGCRTRKAVLVVELGGVGVWRGPCGCSRLDQLRFREGVLLPGILVLAH